MEDYPSNSMRSRETTTTNNKQTETPKGKKVVSGKVTKKKKNEFVKILEAFMPKDLATYKHNFIYNIVIPSIQGILTSGVNDLFDNGTNNKRNGIGVSYDNYYNTTRVNRVNRGGNGVTMHKAYSFDDPIFDSRFDAEEVLNGMRDIIRQYNVVSVADLYDLAGIAHSYTENKYGWNDISSASVMRANDGYYIRLPKALPF